MIHTTRCPDASRWHALIADTDVPDYVELETHLANCARCRKVLDEVAVGSSGWLRDASRLAGTTDNDPEMTKTLHRLRDFYPDDDHGAPIVLDFLTPTDQPGLLGTLGRYQVMEVIGRGAMGIVLKAIDTDLLRPVAIKVMAPYLSASGTARQRFLREARAAAAVSHDHIVTIHAVEPGELPYLVMEYISGISLQARLDRDGPLPPKDIARIGHQAACGLAAAHSQGLVHRDIKPANILLENGVERVKITDFGLGARADDARLTQSGTAAGTPLYMSPEQTRGETVDQRSDLFSLGSVLYTLATGFPPFRAGNTMGVLNRIANDPPRPIRETVPDFPAALEAIIMQLLEKDPANRFQLAADVSIKLAGFLADPQADVVLRRPEARRRRGTPKWVETVLPLLAGIFVVSIVLVFTTKNGTLVIRVDDPDVEVAIDGEVVKISGTGVTAVRVFPGSYTVQASKDGKSVTIDPSHPVHIQPFDKKVVRVTGKVEGPPIESKSNGAVPKRQPAAVRTDAGTTYDDRLKTLTTEYGGLMDRLAETRAGRVLLTTGPGADPDKATAALSDADKFTAKRLLVLRDQFAILAPQFQKAIGGWEKAKLDGRVTKERAEAGVIALNELEAAQLTLKDAERALGTTEKALAKIVSDLKLIAGQAGVAQAGAPSAEDAEASFKSVLAEYEALVLRIVKTPVGRILVTVGPENVWTEDWLKDNRVLNVPAAIRLLRPRDEIVTHKMSAEGSIATLKKIGREHPTDAQARDEAATQKRVAEQNILVRTAAIRTLLAELSKVADEIAPSPSPEEEFQKLIAEYEALLLRLAKTTVGRVQVKVKPNLIAPVEVPSDLSPEQKMMATRLLNLRNEVVEQWRLFEESQDGLVASKKDRQASAKGDPKKLADAEAAMRKHESDLRLHVEVLRGLMTDLKRLADQIEAIK